MYQINQRSQISGIDRMEGMELIALSPRTGSAIWYKGNNNNNKKTLFEQKQNVRVTDLPQIMVLQILSFLSPSQLGIAAQVCRQWRILSDDQILWRKIVRIEIAKTKSINHIMCKNFYQDRNSRSKRLASITPKEIFIESFPKRNKASETKQDGVKKSLTTIWQKVSTKKTKKIILYGHGLRNPSKSRRILQYLLGVSTDEMQTNFKVTGLMPGDGCRIVMPILEFLLNGRSGILGAWISVEFKEREFTLITICEANGGISSDEDASVATKKESLFASSSISNSSSSSSTFSSSSLSLPSSVALATEFHQLFDDADGFVCVVDAQSVLESSSLNCTTNTPSATSTIPTNSNQTSATSKTFSAISTETSATTRKLADWEKELMVLLPRNAHSHKLRMKAAPLLVLPLIDTVEIDQIESKETAQSIDTVFEIVSIMNSKNLLHGRPWQVNCVDFKTMNGLSSGFDWLLDRN